MENTLTLHDDQMARRIQKGLAVSLGVNALAISLAAWSATVTRTTTNPNTTPPEVSLTFTVPSVETPALRHAPIPRPVVIKTRKVRTQPELRRTRANDRPQPRQIARANPAPTVLRPSAAPVVERREPATPSMAPTPLAPTAIRAAAGPQSAALRTAQVRSVATTAVAAPASASVHVSTAVNVAPDAPRLTSQSLAQERTTIAASTSERLTVEIVAPSGAGIAAPSVARRGERSVAAAASGGVAAPAFRTVSLATSGAAPAAATVPGRVALAAARPANAGGALAALPSAVGRSVDTGSAESVASVADRDLQRRAATASSTGVGSDARTVDTVASAARREPQVRASSRTASEATVAESRDTGIDATPERPLEARLAQTNRAGGNAQGDNRDAEALAKTAPQLTAEQKRRSFKGQVQAEVSVDPDGSHSVRLIRGSGDADIDETIVAALRQWRWKPALRNGEKVRSTHQFRYDVRIAD